MAINTDKPHRRKEARPVEIVEAAMSVFIEKGFAGAKIIDIARRANSAKGTVYLYFETKEKLFEAVVRQFIQPGHNETLMIASDFEGPSSDLLSLILHRFYSEFVGNEHRRAIMQILISEGHRFPELTKFYYEEIISRAEQMLKQVIKRGTQSGEFRKTSAQSMPQVLIGPAIMAAIWKMTFDKAATLNLKKFADAHVEFVLNSLSTNGCSNR